MRAPVLLAVALLPASALAQSGPIAPSPSAIISATSPDGEVVIERIVDADLLPGGGVVVADGPANSLLFFDATGKLVRRTGGTGDGPGEFRRLWGVEVCGATVIAHELVATSLERYTPAGEARGRVQLASPVTAMAPLRCGPGGTFAAMIEARPAGQPGPGAVTVPFSASLALFDSVGALVTKTAIDSAVDMVMVGGGGAPSPLAPMLSFASTGEQLVFGTGAEPAVRVMNRSGAIGRAPLTLEAARVTAADLEQGRSAWLEIVPPRMQEALGRQYDALPTPARLPYYRRVIPAAGSIVLLEVTGPGASNSRYVATDGLGRSVPYELPVSGQLLAVNAERALILVTDDDGEQRLQVHEVRGRRPFFVIPRQAPPL